METTYSQAGLWALLLATFILAVTHSVSPDHWVPFVMVGRAKRWKTSVVLGLAGLAGMGHVGTSVAIGLIGVFAEQGASREIATFLENATFALATIGTIVLLTWLGVKGLSWIKLEFFDEYGDIMAGVVIGLLGVISKVFEL